MGKRNNTQLRQPPSVALPPKAAMHLASLVRWFAPQKADAWLQNMCRFQTTKETLNGYYDDHTPENSVYGRGYDAGQRYGPNQSWLPPTRQSEDSIIRSDGSIVRSRARDLVRNNGYVSGAIRRIVNNVVHKGFKLQVQLENKELAQLVENQHASWAKRIKLFKLQQMSIRHLAMDGESFNMRYVRRDLLKEGIVPLGIKGVEPDQLDSSSFPHSDSIDNTGRLIRNGIVFNDHMEPVEYYIYPQHPDDYWSYGYNQYESEIVPAKNIMHMFYAIRVSQGRGVSPLASVVMSAHDLNELTSAELIAARIMSYFGIFIETSEAYPNVMPESFGGTSADTSQHDQFRSDLEGAYLEPGRMQVLPPGLRMTQAENKRPGPQFDAMAQVINRQSASGIGQDYESYASDYRGSSYSSARSASLETQRGYDVLGKMLVDDFLDPSLDWFVMLGKMTGILPASVPDILPHRWIPPGRPWIDPLKDIQAKTAEIELGVTSRSEVAAAMGKDFEEVLLQAVRDKKLLEEHGFSTSGSASDGETKKDNPQQEDEEDDARQQKTDDEETGAAEQN